LALQGDVREHRAALTELGVPTTVVTRPAHLDGLSGIILPGGESTTLSMLLVSSGLFSPLQEALKAGLAAFGTCAGLVLLADQVLDGRPDQQSFGVLDCTVQRNGYGRQLQSFEAVLDAGGLGTALGHGPATLPAVFIRAPVIVNTGPKAEVLATVTRRGDDEPKAVALRQGSLLATAFHPELTPDRRLHELFCQMAGQGL
jgi:pyridoxal 5'-phosphate synthase pdxT subunit